MLKIWALKVDVISFLIIKLLEAWGMSLQECVTAPFKLHLFAFYFSKSHPVNLSPSAVLSSHLNTSKKHGAAAETRSNRMSRDIGFLSWQVAWSFLCQSQSAWWSQTQTDVKRGSSKLFLREILHMRIFLLKVLTKWVNLAMSMDHN